MLDLTIVVCTRISNATHLAALKRCIESIKTFIGINEQTRIVIVDSDSPDKSYMNEFVNEEFIHIENIQNKNYEAGAWLHAYNTYVSDRYLFIHDNTTLTTSIDVLNEKLISIFYALNNWEAATGEEIAWAIETFSTTYWKTPPQSFTAISGSMFYVTRSILEELVLKGLFNRLPTNKMESQAFERYIGLVFASAGYEEELLNAPRLPITKQGSNRQ